MIFGKYKFIIKFKDAAVLPPYKGSSFRGLLGHALKRTVCALKRQTCETCILRANCIYALVFETNHAVAKPANIRLSAPPHPMVLEPPLTTKEKFAKGDSLSCNLIFFGDINRNLPYFIYAFDQMGKTGLGKKINGRRAEFTLERVTHEQNIVYDKQDNCIKMPEILPVLKLDMESGVPSPEQIKLTFITPLRIQGKNIRIHDQHSAVPELSFSLLIRSLIRRTTSLLNTYGEGEPDLDYSGIVQKAALVQTMQFTTGNDKLSWFDWKRYSARQDKKMFMGGLIGEIEYKACKERDLSIFMPFLRMAEKVHAGKNTSFGLGKINISLK